MTDHQQSDQGHGVRNQYLLLFRGFLKLTVVFLLRIDFVAYRDEMNVIITISFHRSESAHENIGLSSKSGIMLCADYSRLLTSSSFVSHSQIN